MNPDPKASARRAWTSIALGFSIFPVVALAVGIISLNSKDYRHVFYTGLVSAFLAVALETAGLLIGIVGVVKGPRRTLSALGVAVCLFFGGIALLNIVR